MLERLPRISQLAVSTAVFPEGFYYNVIIATSSHVCDALTDVGLNAVTNGVVVTLLLPPIKLGLFRCSLRYRGCGFTA